MAVCPLASDVVTVNAKDCPDVVTDGVPESVPELEFKLTPVGSAPDDTVNV